MRIRRRRFRHISEKKKKRSRIFGPSREHRIREPQKRFFLITFLVCPFRYLYFISFLLLNEPGLGAGIDPGMALTPFPPSIG